MIRVVCTGICNIIQDFLADETESLCDCEQPHRSECSLCIDVETLAFTATHVEGQLAGHCERMADLTLTCSELSKNLRD